MKSILILAAATLALTTGSAGANDSSHYYIAKGSSCASGPTGATAKVSMLMYADPFLRTYATNFILHTRLIPHGQTLPGQNWPRTWSTTVSPSIIGGGPTTWHKLILTSTAKVPDLEKDWDLQIKMQWKRDSRPDWNKTLVLKHFQQRCSKVGVSLPDVSAPSVNG